MSLKRTPFKITTSDVTSLQFLPSGADAPPDADLLNFVVIVPAFLSGLDGPSYGYIQSQTSILGTISKRVSSRQVIAYVVGELIGGVSNGNTTVVKRAEIVFAKQTRFDLNVDSSLYAFGRTIKDDIIVCAQTIDARIDDSDAKKPKLFFTVACRNGSPIAAPWEIAASRFVETNFNEFSVGFGHGAEKGKFNKLEKWGVYFNSEVGKTHSVDGLFKTSSTPRAIVHKEQLILFLDGDGDPAELDLQEYISENILVDVHTSIHAPSPSVSAPSIFSSAAPPRSLPAAAPTPLVPKKLSFAPDDVSITDSIDRFDGLQGLASAPVIAPPYTKSGSGFHMNVIQVANHNALFEPSLFSGTFANLPLESRAEFLFSKEQQGALYHVTRSAIMIIMDGSFGTKALASFNATSIIPMDKKEFVDTNKWNVITQPTSWIESMSTLAKTVKNVVCIVQRYYRPDIALALNLVYEHAYYWADSLLPQHGVNAYRDLYRGVLTSTIMAATQGLRGDALVDLTRSELAPSSSVYHLTITARQLRLNSGSAWNGVTHPTSAKQNPSGGGGAKKNTDRDLSDAQTRVIPKGSDGQPMCLAFQSVKGCQRPVCTFSHEALDIPPILLPVLKARYGKLK